MADQKLIGIIVPGAEQGGTTIEEVNVEPGTRVIDVLNQLQRTTGYVLAPYPTGEPLDTQDMIYSKVDKGSKLVLTPKADAGDNSPAPLIKRMARLIAGGLQEAVKVAPRSIPTVPARQPALVHRSQAAVVVVDKRPLWQAKGWKKDGDRYSGKYEVGPGSFDGLIIWGNHGLEAIKIKNPPAVTQLHERWPCFQHIGDSWFVVHPSIWPENVDSAIVMVERILSESYRKTRGQYVGSR